MKQLIGYALLTCRGDTREKTITYYYLLKEGGLDHHQRISANCKNFKVWFMTLAGMACWDLYDMIEEINDEDNVFSPP